jgi:hypothetical protein
MDRMRAYKVLLAEMDSISAKAHNELKELSSAPIDSDFFAENGAHYSISVNIIPVNDNSFLIKGSIHDNSSFKYALLEEEMVVKK